MTIKQQGGIFGRNPTFNNVTVDGVLTVDQIVEKTGASGITLDGVTLKDGNVVLADGNGIDFSATSGTGTSELLDDYEEGSWSPVVNAYSGTPTTSGYYTKIGQQVTLEGSVQLDGTSDASVVRFSGLPFTVASPYIGGAYLTYNSGGVADVIVNIDSSSRLELRNSSATQLSFNTIGVSALLTFVVSYRAA
tara:strand:- start:773 stop:1348 length:576 start_codon:yes stop_codon:yes gene_type:complete